MVMFEVYVLKGGVDSEVDVGFIVIELLKGPHCFCKPKPRETVEFVARSQVSTHFLVYSQLFTCTVFWII